MKFEVPGEEGVEEIFEASSYLQWVDAVSVQLSVLADCLSLLEKYLPVSSRRTACLRNIINCDTPPSLTGDGNSEGRAVIRRSGRKGRL